MLPCSCRRGFALQQPLQLHAKGRRVMCSVQQSGSGGGGAAAGSNPRLAAFFRSASRAIAVSIVSAVLTVAALPAFLSWKTGLNAAVWLANQTIPGDLTVGKANLGWRKPVELKDIVLEDGAGEQVVRIQKVISNASLASILLGKRGLGDFTVSSLWINLLDDESSGISRLALALEPVERRPVKAAKKRAETSTATIQLVSDFKVVNGGLRVVNGELLVAGDAAAALGSKLLVDIFVGSYAVEQNQELLRSGSHLPISVNIWSDCLQAQAAGHLDILTRKLQLIKPIKIEMDLTPELGRLYLARVNPLLGYIVGPAVVEEDLPDVILRLTPKNMTLPADEYDLSFEPMRVVAKGPLLDTIFKLFSKTGESQQQSQLLTMETGSVHAAANVVTGLLTCSRLDVVIGGRMHLVTWGDINWIQEVINTQVSVPQQTLKDLLGLSLLPRHYHLQFTVGGTFDRPELDVKSALIRIARLTLQQQAGSFGKSFLGGTQES